MDNIILTGFMGSGKTSVGIRLSYCMKCIFEDTDRIIERREKRSISEIFETCGETAFREMETECLRDLLALKGCRVLSVGGGLAVNPVNGLLLHQLGTIVYLEAEPATIYERLKNDTTRPLLQTRNPEERIRELMEQRRPAYERLADLTVKVDGLTVNETADRILQSLPPKS